MKHTSYFILLFLIPALVSGTNETSIDSLQKIVNHEQGDKKIDAQIKLSLLLYDLNPATGISMGSQAIAECKKSANGEMTTTALLNMGALYQKTSNYDSALFFYKKALNVKKTNTELAKVLDNIGVAYRELGKYDSAIVYHKQAQSLCETMGDKKGAAYSLNNIGNVYSREGDFAHALDYYKESLQLREESNLTDETAASYENIGDIYKKLNNYDKALDNLTKALDIRNRGNDDAKIAYSLNSIGNFYLQIKIYNKAREYYSKALDIRIKLGDKLDMASTYNNIGTLHRELGNYDKAFDYYHKALELRKQTGNKEAMASSLNNIGALYWNKKVYDQAITYYKMALDIRKELGEKAQIAASLKNIGIIYKDMNDYKTALDYYDQSQSISLAINDYFGIATVQNLKGNLYKKMNEPAKSIVFYKNAYDLYKTYDQRKEMSAVASNLGTIFAESGDNAKAIFYFNEAFKVSNEMRDKETAKTVAQGLADMYKKMGDYKKSLEFLTLSTALKDSILSDMNNKRIAEIEFDNALKTKDSEIESQQFKITQNENKIKQQRIYLLSIFVVVILIITFTILILLQFAQKRKAYHLLNIKSKQVEEANEQLEVKNKELEIKNMQITDGLNYAKQIQEAILPSKTLIGDYLDKFFIFYKPKEVVSGDFYWFSAQGDYIFAAVIDCTGHGVPGAFMSMIGNTLLNEIVTVNKTFDTAEILTKLDKGVMKALKQDIPLEKKYEDGMDITLCKIDKKAQTIQFSSANHKLVVIRNKVLESIVGDGIAIGGMYSIKQRRNIKYTSQEIAIEKGMKVYLHSDGIIDQFGGNNHERFKSPRFHKLLTDIYQMNMNEQLEAISTQFETWKGNDKQLDDVLVMGIEF